MADEVRATQNVLLTSTEDDAQSVRATQNVALTSTQAAAQTMRGTQLVMLTSVPKAAAPPPVADSTPRRILTLAVRDGLADAYDVFTDEGSGYLETNSVQPFTPSGLLVDAYARSTAALDLTGFTIEDTVDIELLTSTDAVGRVRGELLCIIDNEWLSVTTITDNGDGTFDIAANARGVFDTLPADHAAGARVWFVSEGAGLTQEDPYTVDLTLQAKCVPFNSLGSVALGSVSAVSLTTASRAAKPYPPGNVKVNGVYWPNGSTYAGDVTLTWAHRIRSQENVVQQDAPDQTSTPEGNYRVQVLIDGALVRTTIDIVATSYVYTWAQRQADNPNTALPVKFVLTPVNGALEGRARTTDQFFMEAP